ncbi:MAG TPA: DedA family protein [Kofleriaceae bacterium]|nr:DedA family protein [Kofleriaceae bacterium]
MDWLTDWLIGFASDRDHPAGLALLAGAACFEFLFPPIPGDTITLLGAALISAFGWSWVLVVPAVLLGSLAGAACNFLIGRRLRARGKTRASVEGLMTRFERHGAAYLIINRFLPGVRAVAFIAAGMSNMRAPAVFLYGGLSIALWNGLLIALGATLGANLEVLQGWLDDYTIGAWILLGSVAVLIIGLHRVRRWRRRARSLE